jgi:hypothetical protein
MPSAGCAPRCRRALQQDLPLVFSRLAEPGPNASLLRRRAGRLLRPSSCSPVASAVASRRAVNDSVRIWLRSSPAKGQTANGRAHVCCRATVPATADPSTGRWELALEHNTHPTIQATRQLLVRSRHKHGRCSTRSGSLASVESGPR